jgi:LytS/YehU family sensor histidine kinase
LIENYLAIERIRFSNRLVVELIYDFDAGSVFLPPLILQPLLENAIKYGLHSEDVAVPIVLKAILDDSGLQIIVSNPISKVNAAHGTGFGINGVQRRLYLLYRQTNLLGTEVLNHQFIVKLLIPQYTI